MDRETLVKLQVIEKILDKQSFEELIIHEPFAASILLDNFKDFLSDVYFEKVERQLTLYKFLRNYYPLEISSDIIDYASNCDLKDDYTRLIMEWNLVSSDYIRKYNLNKYDCAGFASNGNQNIKSTEEEPKYIIVDCVDLILEGLNQDETGQ